MTKLTGAVVAAHIANPPSKDPDFGSIYLSIEEVNQNVADAESMTRAYEAASSNFDSMAKAKSESLNLSFNGLNLSDMERQRHYNEGMASWRSSAFKRFDALAIESFRKANALLDAVRESEKYNTGPIVLAGRYAVGVKGNENYNAAWARCDGVQPMELKNIAVVAMKNRSPDLCATVVRRLAQMSKGDRDAVGITHLQLSEAGFGEQFRAMQRGLSFIKEHASTVRERYRNRMAGGDGKKSSNSKIRDGLAAMQRGPAPKNDEPAPEPTAQPKKYITGRGWV